MNNDWLEDKLRQDDRYLDDTGFTARVVAALPARRERRWLRPVILGTTAVAGLALALWLLPSENHLVSSFVQLVRARTFSAVPLLPVVLIALMFWATITAVAREN
jgi:hypothetical protein